MPRKATYDLGALGGAPGTFATLVVSRRVAQGKIRLIGADSSGLTYEVAPADFARLAAEAEALRAARRPGLAPVLGGQAPEFGATLHGEGGSKLAPNLSLVDEGQAHG